MRSMRCEQVARGLKQIVRIADRGKGREGEEGGTDVLLNLGFGDKREM